jgi:hypothetical protein
MLRRHQEFICALPCAACGKPAPSECAQVGGGRSDRYIVPLCGPSTIWQDCCHSRRHYLGQKRFWSELGTDPLKLAARLWRVSGQIAAGEQLVMRRRQVIALPGDDRRAVPK